MSASAQARPPLTKDRILHAALEIIDTNGVDGLSMRALGAHLHVDPMAVYHYLPNKAALYDGLVEHLWLGVHISTARPGETWPEVLQQFFMALRRRLLEHPRAVVLLGTRPAVTPAMLRLTDDQLGRLAAVGLPRHDAMQLIDCLAGYTVGKVLGEIGEPLGGVNTTVQSAMAAVTPQTHPQLTQAIREGYQFSPEDEFVRGLTAMITGWNLGR